MDQSDEDDNPYDFVAQYKKLKTERAKGKMLIGSKVTQPTSDNEPPVVSSTTISQTYTLVDATPSTSGLSSNVRHNHIQAINKPYVNSTASTSRQPNILRGRRQQKKKTHGTDSTNVIGPVICIGDFDDGYEISPPTLPKVTSKKDDIYDIDILMANWRKKHETDDDEVAVDELNRVMNVKVYWRESRTHIFHIRMFQTIESIYEYFAKLENIDKTHVSLVLHSKLLSPTDTPHSINYKIVDFIDGDIVFYRSPYDKPNSVPEEVGDAQQDDGVVTFRIKQKDVKRPIIMEFKKSEKMIILYIKLSEKLGFDLDSFTLEFDGDKIKHSDTMKSLDLEGDECFELFQKKKK